MVLLADWSQLAKTWYSFISARRLVLFDLFAFVNTHMHWHLYPVLFKATSSTLMLSDCRTCQISLVTVLLWRVTSCFWSHYLLVRGDLYRRRNPRNTISKFRCNLSSLYLSNKFGCVYILHADLTRICRSGRCHSTSVRPSGKRPIVISFPRLLVFDLLALAFFNESRI